MGNIFLEERFNNLESLNESLLDTIKKFYTGKSEEEIKHFQDKIEKIKSPSDAKKIEKEINDSIKTAEDFKNTPVLKRFFGDSKSAAASAGVLALPGGIPAILSSAALSVWFRSGKALRSLNLHIKKLIDLRYKLSLKL